MSFLVTGVREMRLKVRRQRTRWTLQHEKRLLQKAEIALGREGTAQATNFPELRNEIVALKKLEQEQREVGVRIKQVEEALAQIEQQRQKNSQELKEAVGKLEEERKPILQRLNEAKATAELCDRELSRVERRVQENDAVDRDFLKKIAELQARVPPPDDLEEQTERISSQRARLPEERAELFRAREGSADACRQAKERLSDCQEELDRIDRRIAKVREEFEGRDRELNNSARAQQDSLKEARAQHQTVEKRKDPAYLNIGRHLATQGIAPPNAPHLLADVTRHRGAMDVQLQHKAELALLSEQIDKQELRKFYFCVVSVLILLAIILPVFLKSPAPREWLPRETEVILSINTDHLTRSPLLQRWRREQGDSWQTVSNGLLGSAAGAPGIDVPRQAKRVTRAVTTEKAGGTREFVLVESGAEANTALRNIAKKKEFEQKLISGLPLWRNADTAVARVGPSTFAVGNPREVEELVQVRLGLKPDLKITGPLFEEFQALDQQSTLRLISRDPPNLSRLFEPVFIPELLEPAELLGLSVTLQNPIKARLLVRLKTEEAAAELARRLRDEPQRWLRLQESDLMLFQRAPEVTRREATVDAHFEMPEGAARLLLERLARVQARPVVAKE